MLFRRAAWLAAALLAAPALAAPAAELEVFVRDGCPHCADAKAFLTELQREQPDLRITFRPVDDDPQARAELELTSPHLE